MTPTDQPADNTQPTIRYEYQPPMVTPIGNLHTVVAGTTQQLACDGVVPDGHGDQTTGC